jgi:DMSO/TMAO reductase YedYZ molybdopterin-dependent catalytic subunit
VADSAVIRDYQPMMRRVQTYLLAAFSLATLGAAAPGPSEVALSGDVPNNATLTVAELEKLGPETASWSDNDQSHAVYGVVLEKILAQAGFAPGPKGKGVSTRDKRAGLKKILRVSAADGFEAIFSLGELLEEVGNTKAMLIWKMDGKPLPASAGVFRVVVLTDKEPSRSIYKVSTMEVIDMRKK